MRLKKYRRFIARIRTLVPLAPYLPGVVIVQTLAQSLSKSSFALSLLPVILLAASAFWFCWRRFAYGFAVGLLSVLPFLCAVQIPVAEGTQYARVSSILRRPFGQVVLDMELLGTVTRGAGGASDEVKFSPSSHWYCKAIMLPWREMQRVKNGNTLAVRGSFRPLETPVAPWTFEGSLRRRGYQGSCKLRYIMKLGDGGANLFEIIREKSNHLIESVLGPGEASGLVKAGLLGTRDVISEQTEKAYLLAGLIHVLVLSGFQIVWVFAACRRAGRAMLSFFPRERAFWSRVASVMALLAAGCFGLLSGFDGPAQRAVLALFLVWLLTGSQRPQSLSQITFNTLVVLSVLSPGAIWDPGVELTFAALFAIAFAVRRDSGFLENYLRLHLSVWIFTGLITALRFQTLSLLGLFFNPLLAPLLSFLSFSVAGFAVVCTALRVPGGHILLLATGNALYVLSAWLCSAVRWFPEKLSQLPCSFWTVGLLLLLSIKISIRFGQRFMRECNLLPDPGINHRE